MKSERCEYFTLYTQSTPVLIQFALREFLEAYPQVTLIEKLSRDLDQKLLGPSLEERTNCLSELTKAIAHLTGSPFVEDNPLPWTSSKGSLGNLRHHVFLYSMEDTEIAGTCADTRQHTSRAYHSAMQAREVIQTIRQPLDKERQSVHVGRLTTLLSRVVESVRKLAHLFSAYIYFYKKDENILYFLLRHRQQLDQVYPEGFVKLMFSEIFEGGIDATGSFIKEQYRERGFDHLLSTIDRHIKELAGE